MRKMFVFLIYLERDLCIFFLIDFWEGGLKIFGRLIGLIIWNVKLKIYIIISYIVKFIDLVGK